MRSDVRWTVAPAFLLLGLLPALATAQPVTVTVVLASGERHTGQNLQHRFDKMGGEVSLRKSQSDQLRVSPDQVDYVDFGGTADAAVSLSGSQRAVVLRDGSVVRGQLIEMAHSSFEDQDTPYLVIIRDDRGQERRFPASEVGRVYFRSSAAPGPPQPPTVAPPAGGGFAVPARRQWTSTGIIVRRGETLTLTTTGEIRLSDSEDDLAGPAGSRSQRLAPGSPLPNNLAGALIGRIGAYGRPFGIGDQTSIRMPEAGELFLGINDDEVGDNQGEFRVAVRRSSAPIRR